MIHTTQWYDAWDMWRLNLEDGAVTNLMTPPGLKELVKNSSRLQHGVRYEIPTTGFATPKLEENNVDLPVHIISTNQTDYFQSYQSFCDMVLLRGSFSLWTKYIPHKIFRLVYHSCTNFNQCWRQISVFTLKCTEPDPNDFNADSSREGTPQGYSPL